MVPRVSTRRVTQIAREDGQPQARPTPQAPVAAVPAVPRVSTRRATQIAREDVPQTWNDVPAPGPAAYLRDPTPGTEAAPQTASHGARQTIRVVRTRDDSQARALARNEATAVAELEDAAAAALLDEEDCSAPVDSPVRRGEAPDEAYDSLALRANAQADAFGPLGERAKEVKAPATPPDPTRQSNVKMVCPNCGCAGELPWGRMDSKLCCSRCWRWYQVATGGRLKEVPAPKNFAKGSLHFHAKDGPARKLQVTPREIKRRRRQWVTAQLFGLRTMFESANKEIAIMFVVLLYVIGMFGMCYTQFTKSEYPVIHQVNVGLDENEPDPEAVE